MIVKKQKLPPQQAAAQSSHYFPFWYGPEGISVAGWNWTNYLLFVMQMGKPLYYVVTKLNVTAHNKKIVVY